MGNMVLVDDTLTMRSEEPNEEAQALLKQAEQTNDPPGYATTIAHSRKGTNAFLADFPSEEVEHTRDFAIPGPGEDIAVRLYEPAGAGPHPIIVFAHGGGWVQCNLDTHDNICAALTNRAECLVLSVDYRLAPEHPFPAGLEDLYRVLKWVEQYAPDVNADPERIVVGGDSSGGNLAAAAALLAREREGPSLAHQLLIIPVTNYAFDTDSYEENAEGYLSTREALRYFWNQYLETDIDGYNSFASPLRATSHAGLPPATVVTAGFDPVRDDGIHYAEALHADGVPVELMNYEDTIHGFINRPHMWDHADEAMDDIAAHLKAALMERPE